MQKKREKIAKEEKGKREVEIKENKGRERN